MSRELIQTGLLAVVAAISSMLIYIWFRFEWQFSVGAILALVHDVILTIGVFSLLQLDFNLSNLAANLTIVGYSLNDTVVVYDRVRENLRKYKKMDISELLDIAITQTLSRTVMTSVTTLLALIALYTLGGEVIRGFTFAMIWGVLVGTYSSIFIAAPLLIRLVSSAIGLRCKAVSPCVRLPLKTVACTLFRRIKSTGEMKHGDDFNLTTQHGNRGFCPGVHSGAYVSEWRRHDGYRLLCIPVPLAPCAGRHYVDWPAVLFQFRANSQHAQYSR